MPALAQEQTLPRLRLQTPRLERLYNRRMEANSMSRLRRACEEYLTCLYVRSIGATVERMRRHAMLSLAIKPADAEGEKEWQLRLILHNLTGYTSYNPSREVSSLTIQNEGRVRAEIKRVAIELEKVLETHFKENHGRNMTEGDDWICSKCVKGK